MTLDQSALSLDAVASSPRSAAASPAGAARAGPQDPAPSATVDGRITARTLILTRWIAIQGQLLTVFTVHFGFGFALPIGPVLATIGASVLVNIVATIQPMTQPRLGDRDAAQYLGYDTLQLTLLLYLTGGLTNPFSILLLAPLTVAAAILSDRWVILLTALSQACLTVLALWHFPLPWPEGGLSLPLLYRFGIWLGLSLSSVFIAAYVFRVAREARRIADALAATQLGLAREQRLSALGALAAAAAHELGTPLGTIAVVVKELARDLTPDSPMAEDVALLQSESERCRTILARLSEKPEGDGGSPLERMALTGVIEAAADPYRAGSNATLEIVRDTADDDSPEPVLRRSPEIMHGLGNLMQNALQFATRVVTVQVKWSDREVVVVISDDGPGFPSHLLARIGEPFLSGRSARTGHMGLGIFIAQTLLERTGATLEFGNNRRGGARVVVRWHRQALDFIEQGA